MFSTPLFCQIQSLVTSLTKKNQRANISELHQVCVLILYDACLRNDIWLQLIMLYGEDARIFLIGCLFDDIDFRDQRTHGHKDSQKVIFLKSPSIDIFNRPSPIFLTRYIALDRPFTRRNTSEHEEAKFRVNCMSSVCW